jgi:hypothetical protein
MFNCAKSLLSSHSFRKTNSHQRRIFQWHFLIAFLCFGGLAWGQVNPGYPSFNPQDCGQHDCINLQNLNVSLNVPVMSKSGAFPFSFAWVGAGSYVCHLQ